MAVPIWLSFVGASLVFGLIPGPSVCFTMAEGMRRGLSGAVPSILGQLTANTLQLLIICVGLNNLLERSVGLFTVLRILGAAYLVYIGFKQWFAPRPALNVDTGFLRSSTWKGFADGFIVCGTNPKALLYYAAFLPQFIVPQIDRNVQLLILGVTSLSVAGLILTFYTMLAGRIRTWLLERGFWRLQNRFIGIVMIAAGTTLALAHEK